jgi:transposase
LLRYRGERLERPFAHLYETGRMRRVHLRGYSNILKRLLLHDAALNLGLLMRTLVGVGTPRSLQGRIAACLCSLWSFTQLPDTRWEPIWAYIDLSRGVLAYAHVARVPDRFLHRDYFSHGC